MAADSKEFAASKESENRICKKTDVQQSKPGEYNSFVPSFQLKRWSRFPEQNGGLAKVDSGLDYAAHFSSSAACVA